MFNELGRLERVELRGVWPNEATDFTPWLAEEENLSILAETLNMELEIEGREVKLEFGGIVDLLCRNTEDDSRVLIENQVEETDSDHLGRILEYMAGLDAVTVIWISKSFEDEHRAVFDRLNEISEERFRFFGVEIELWRIGDSLPAPEFNIVSKPNDWIRTVSQEAQRAANENLSETQLQQKRFWTAFSEHVNQTNCQINAPRPVPRAFVFLPIGRTGFMLKSLISPLRRKLVVRLNMSGPNAETHFNLLIIDREEIENEIGELREDEQLEWKEESNAVVLTRHNIDPTDEEDWPNQHAWLAEKLELFDRVFRQRVRALDADNSQSEDEDDK